MTIDPIWLYIGLILLSFLSIALFFLHSRSTNEAQALLQQSEEQKVQLTQLSPKAAQLATEKAQGEPKRARVPAFEWTVYPIAK